MTLRMSLSHRDHSSAMTSILDIDLDYFRFFDDPLDRLHGLLNWARRPVDKVALIVTLPTASTLPLLKTPGLPESRWRSQASGDSSWQGYDQARTRL